MEDPHQRRLAQLHWELEQRRGQTQLSDQLKKETEEAAATIQSQEEKLGSLLPRINAILEVRGGESSVGREVGVASGKPHAHGNRMKGRAKGYKGAVDRVMEDDTCTTTAMGATNLRYEQLVTPWAWCKTSTQYQL